MADHFGLAETRQADGSLAPRPAQPVVGNLHVGQVYADRAMAQLEDQTFFMVQAAVAGDGGDTVGKGFAGVALIKRRWATLIVHAHLSTSWSAAVSAAKSSSLLVSVAARIS